jgi:pimeloyl-ACP methyl ester carboxylesterase/AraC-like DNA-binding protein
MDVLTDILGSLRLTGGVVIDGEFSGDFCVRAQFTPAHCAPFFPLPETLISYHYVRSGRLIVQMEGDPPISLEAGTIVILPRNDPHLLASRVGLPPAEASDIVWITQDGVHHVESGTDGPKAEVWCGFLGTAKTNAHPLLDALPPLLVLDARESQADWLDSSMRFMAEEQPSPDVVARLAELFLAHAINDYAEKLPPGSTGWLRGLTDPAVSRALSIIHSRYAEDLDVEGLAREAGVSRSVLGERFVELIGEPPMRYCARWRMRMAANMLRDGKHNSANIAYAVGFNSEAAFNRAFKREYGEPPGTWRRHIEEAERARSMTMAGRDLPRTEVRYCEAADGTRLAYAVDGEGFPLVKLPNWFNHLERDGESPIWPGWFAELGEGRRLLRFDGRGHGASDWTPPVIAPESFGFDLAAVVNAAELERFDLLGIGYGAAVALGYALRHPERVRRIVMCNGWCVGWARRDDPEDVERRKAIIKLSGIGWDAQTPLYREIYTKLYIPGGSEAQQDWLNEAQRLCTTPENAVAIQEAIGEIDISAEVREVAAPCLLFHARGDQAVPIECGEQLAERLRDVRFKPLDSVNHVYLPGERAWPNFVPEVRAFLGE